MSGWFCGRAEVIARELRTRRRGGERREDAENVLRQQPSRSPRTLHHRVRALWNSEKENCRELQERKGERLSASGIRIGFQDPGEG